MTTTRKLIVGVVLLVAVVAVGVTLTGILDDGLGDRAESILEEPEEFVGERVEVEGELSSFYPGAFTLGGGFLNDDELLILVERDRPLPQALQDRRDDVRVRVTGVVGRKSEAVELVPGERFEPFDDDAPYVRADRVEVIEE